MELVEGETLADRLEEAPLPRQALPRPRSRSRAPSTRRTARASSIATSSRATSCSQGGAKLLDFGLAKSQRAGASAGAASSMPPTTPPNLTAQGTILGTFQYMAPEQLEGREADARTDIFAFGAVLYEMLTGKKAFEGTSQASVSAAIMSADPTPVSALQPLTPPALDRVVTQVLAKDPDERWQSAGDLARELKWLAEGSGNEASAGAARHGAPISAALGVAWGLSIAIRGAACGGRLRDCCLARASLAAPAAGCRRHAPDLSRHCRTRMGEARRCRRRAPVHGLRWRSRQMDDDSAFVAIGPRPRTTQTLDPPARRIG